jgi:hypothetical protein
LRDVDRSAREVLTRAHAVGVHHLETLLVLREITSAIPIRVSRSAMSHTQPPLFFTGVADGSTGVCAAAETIDVANSASEPATSASSRQEVFIARILATGTPSGNRHRR